MVLSVLCNLQVSSNSLVAGRRVWLLDHRPRLPTTTTARQQRRPSLFLSVASPTASACAALPPPRGKPPQAVRGGPRLIIRGAPPFAPWINCSLQSSIVPPRELMFLLQYPSHLGLRIFSSHKICPPAPAPRCPLIPGDPILDPLE